MDDERSPLLGSNDAHIQSDVTVAIVPTDVHNLEVKTEKKRWYILFVFGMLSLTQNLIWNCFGPIAQSAQLAMGWSNGTIALLANWGPIAYIIAAFPFSWLLDRAGLRWSCLLTSLLITCGAAIRCITMNPNVATWLIHVGHFLNGLGGPVLMAGPPLVSNTWFPVEQRTTATSISTVIGLIGNAASFFIGPYMVQDVTKSSCCDHNTSLFNSTQCNQLKSAIRHDMLRLMYTEAGLSGFLFLLVVVYFPASPRQPPSRTATTKRTDFLPGISNLRGNSSFWLLVIPYSLSTGLNGGWGSVLDVILKPLRVDEVTAGWIGIAGTLSGLVAALLAAVLVDLVVHKMKIFLLCSFTAAAASYLVLSLMCDLYLPSNLVLAYTVVIILSICILGSTPLFYELGCEAAFPVHEGLSAMVMTWGNNVVGLVMLLLLMIPSIGTDWINWVVTGCLLLCLPVICFYKEQETRYNIDTTTQHKPQ